MDYRDLRPNLITVACVLGMASNMNASRAVMPVQEQRVDTPTSQYAPGSIRMLIVDDDRQVSEALGQYFESEDYVVAIAYDGATALEQMRAHPAFDIVLLDVMLPRMNGFEVLEASHELGLQSPILMMSGRGGQENILRGFGLGAEDYLVKPFDPDELMARVRAILGRAASQPDDPDGRVRLGSLEIDFDAYQILRDGEPVALSELEYDLLRYLVANRGRVVSRKRLLLDAWSIDEDVIIHTISPEVVVGKLEESIDSLRHKLGDGTQGRPLIETVFGQGFRFNG